LKRDPPGDEIGVEFGPTAADFVSWHPSVDTGKSSEAESRMLKVEDYGRIRRAHRDGMGIREIARTFGHSRRKIREALQAPEQKPYTLTQPRPRRVLTEVHQEWIDAVLAADEQAPPKQRHLATQLFRRLRDEEQYVGSYYQVRRYVAARRGRRRETFLPLSYEPGQRAESDFGHIWVDFPAGRRQVPVLVMTWAYSNATFMIALPSEKTEAILHGTVQALAFFGGAPRELWWVNPKTVATAILAGRQRELNRRWQALASHYNLEPLFCLPPGATRSRTSRYALPDRLPRRDRIDATEDRLADVHPRPKPIRDLLNPR
jgi:transposase